MNIYSYLLLILLFFLNNNIINSFHTDEVYDKKFEIQRASFFFLTANAYRYSFENEQWCEESKVQGGRPYLWSEYRMVALSYLDLYIALQFDPDCDDKVDNLRKFYFDNVNQPPTYTNNSQFWESTFLQTAVEAFTCGFKGVKSSDYDFVSHDLRENFDTVTFKQKIWYMIGPYMTSIYKQREKSGRLDFDAGLYIPFLDGYTGFHYTKEQLMRIGYPTYMGRALWHIFHTIAQRIADNQCSSAEIDEKLIEKAKSFIIYFIKNGHPCPVCKEHMISRIMVNDRYAGDLIDNEAMRYYPIEHLLLGGIDGDAKAKISTIKTNDKNSVATFFWIIHNAVTSSVDGGCFCYTEENEDDKPFRCVMDYRVQIQQQFPRQQRSYPFMKRFEYIITPNHNYTVFDNSRSQFKPILNDINELDTFALRSELISYWQTGKTISSETEAKVNKLLELISTMKSQFISSNVLKQVYTYDDIIPLKCETILDKLKSSPISTENVPAVQFDRTPSVCKPYIQPSLCDQTYLYRYFTKPPSTSSSVLTSTTTSSASGNSSPSTSASSTTFSSSSTTDQTKNVQTTSNNSNNSSPLIFNIYLLLILLFISILSM